MRERKWFEGREILGSWGGAEGLSQEMVIEGGAGGINWFLFYLHALAGLWSMMSQFSVRVLFFLSLPFFLFVENGYPVKL